MKAEERELELYLRDIEDSISMVEQFLDGVPKADFMKLPEKQAAVVRKMEVIGEAIKQLPMRFRNMHPHIPWKEIAGMRDKLIHGYFGVNLDMVWDAAKNDLPELKRDIKKLLA